MDKVYIAAISTEDGEEYKFAFRNKPTKEKVKTLFYKQYGDTYSKSDWNVCISCSIDELEILD